MDGRRFRMLFEIDGVDPHEEDTWIGQPVQIGDAVVAPIGDVGRCVVTKRDPDTGMFDLDTLGALAATGETASPATAIWRLRRRRSCQAGFASATR